ncbi:MULTISPECIES: hypothetical protein [unclassified Photorhabdus]|uniref:hypothetical protein n=1 Tax=unclassified Photorhabdus TaxID=2620880 RepID=UPI0011BFBBC4|nr:MULTISPECIES: hypothetical protein [unclassified Photorhabdus]
MNIHEIRRRFELFMDKYYSDVSLSCKTKHGIYFPYSDNETDIKYENPGAQLMWKLFLSGAQSERKNIVVSLPVCKSPPDGFYDAGYNEGIQDCKKALLASGIKIRS